MHPAQLLIQEYQLLLAMLAGLPLEITTLSITLPDGTTIVIQ